jgi:hypothetical protein
MRNVANAKRQIVITLENNFFIEAPKSKVVCRVVTSTFLIYSYLKPITQVLIT